MRTCLSDNRGDFSSYGNLDISVATVQCREKLWVYESVVGFVNATVMLIVKLMTMAVCWSMAILIAPLGLIYIFIIAVANKYLSNNNYFNICFLTAQSGQQYLMPTSEAFPTILCEF